MSWLFKDFSKEICLTCQYCKVPRKIKVIGKDIFIEYGATLGHCKLHNDFPMVITTPPHQGGFCHYKRWLELP